MHLVFKLNHKNTKIAYNLQWPLYRLKFSINSNARTLFLPSQYHYMLNEIICYLSTIIVALAI
jgi:hypothetical protein